eukprot:scaffold952_cov29-Attheya_sp.AAC.2
MSSDSMLAAIVCFISDRILAMRLSSTNMLCSGANLFPSLSKTPLWMLSGIAATNVVVAVGGSDNLTLSRISLCVSVRWVSPCRCLAKVVRARATGSQLAGLVLLPKVCPVGMKRSSRNNSRGDVRVMFGVTECSRHVIIEY